MNAQLYIQLTIYVLSIPYYSMYTVAIEAIISCTLSLKVSTVEAI